MSYFGVSTRNGVGLGLGTVPSLTNTPLGYRLAPSLDLSFAGSDALSPAITFSRTTNATLTNSAGLIANAPMNLLTFSEQFDNAAWGRNNLAVTANSVVAPNGTTTADTITATASAASGKNIAQSTTLTGQSVFSVYAKQGTHQFIQFFANSGTFGQVNFDLLNGTLSATTATGLITAVGNGWYRCTAIFAPSITLAYVAMVTSLAAVRAETWTSVGTESVQLWGAQLELGSTATTYNPTTVKNLLGFTENFDNAAWTKSNAFVQTNLVLQSQSFDNATWTKSRLTITSNAGVAPDGTTTASSAIPTAAAGDHSILQTINATAINTGSWYVKPTGTYTKVAWFEGANTGNYVTFNLSGAGSVLTTSGATGTVSQAGNGWYRITFSWTNNPGALWVSLYALNPSYTSGNPAGGWTPNGTDGFLIWGAQLVQGTTPGDYKATYAAAAAVGYTDIYGQPFAQKLVENTATSIHSLIQPITPTTSTLYTGTLYVKAAERAFAFVGIGQTGNNSFASINLSTGAVSVAFGSPTVSATSIGNGWFRVSVTVASISTASLSLEARVSTDGVWDNRSYTGDGTSGIYIFGAQLSDSASVDPYVYQPVAAPTSTAYYGPRFDYDPVTLAPKGLLIEEQRTNLLTYSQLFSNAAWTKIGATLTSNSAIAPDGTVTAETLVEDASTGNHWCFQSGGAAGAYSATVYAKAMSRSWLVFRFTVSGTITYAWFNVSTGALGTVQSGLTATITSVGNGWYRCSIIGTMSAASPVVIGAANADGGLSYTGNSGSALQLWGAQLEAGSFATSYIPTVASQVTRAADSASMIGNNFARWFNQTVGTVFVQADTVSASINAAAFALGSTTSDIMRIFRQSDAQPVAQVIAGGAAQATLGMGASNWVISTTPKIAFSYAINDFSATANGGTTITDTSGTVPIVSQAVLGNAAGIGALNGHLVRVAFYSRVLASSEQKGITS